MCAMTLSSSSIPHTPPPQLTKTLLPPLLQIQRLFFFSLFHFIKNFFTMAKADSNDKLLKLKIASSLLPIHSLYLLAFSFLPFLFPSLRPHRLLPGLFAAVTAAADDWFPTTVSGGGGGSSPYVLLVRAMGLIPTWHYFGAVLMAVVVFGYNLCECHFFSDLWRGGDQVKLTFHEDSDVYQSVVSKCRILHGRYLSTPWLSSPHLQTAFQGIFGRPPTFNYKREMFHTLDGGTLGLDWLRHRDVAETETLAADDKNAPIVIVVPGLASDSSFPYLKHVSFKIAKRGWDVCVANHRGFGGVPFTSDFIGNGGWTQDIREAINHIHRQYPETPLYVVGTSIGANIMIKYLGEDGTSVPVVGAAAICSPWDLWACNRFLRRGFMQHIYNMAIAFTLKMHAQEHKAFYSRIADWEGIRKARTLEDVDYATLAIGKFKTVDTYYRHVSSANFVENVSVPLLCISSLDDPICTAEAIPWDECRANKNIVLATTKHGGHIAHYEGATADTLWWVRATDEFLDVLHTSRYSNIKEKMQVCSASSLEIPQVPMPRKLEVEERHSDTEKTDPITENVIKPSFTGGFIKPPQHSLSNSYKKVNGPTFGGELEIDLAACIGCRHNALATGALGSPLALSPSMRLK